MKSTALSIILAVCLTPMLASVSGFQALAATPRERSFQFEYKATVKDLPIDAKQVEVWIPVPQNSPFQRITDLQIESPYPYQTNTAQYGNKVLHISLNKPQQSSFTVTMRFNTMRTEHIQARLREKNGSEAK